MKIDKAVKITGKVRLTKDTEHNEKILGEETVKRIKNFRKKTRDREVDISIYSLDTDKING